MPLGLESGNRYGLQCPECAQSTFIETRRRVSYTAHCIPYVTRCPWHGCRLVCDCECSSLELLLSERSGDGRAVNSLHYATRADTLRQRCVSGQSWERVRLTLEEKGYYAAPGRLRVRSFHEDFCRVFSAGFEDARLNYIVSEWKPVQACIRAASRADRAAPAAILVLLDWAADEVDCLSTHTVARRSSPVPADIPTSVRSLKRAQWTEHVAGHPKLSRTEMRLSTPALWAWLYRHDGPWLQRHQVPADVAARKRRPAELPPFHKSAMLRGADPRQRCDGREPLPSSYQLRLAYGMTEYLFNRAMESVCGPGRGRELPGARAVFVDRRLQFAAAALACRGLPENTALLAREARLRVSTVRQFLSHS
ncbi:TnsD family Tn7-like transposition protein [Caballeronia grimmiae]|uniref:TnsD family Tn7-like transposition protein n=1 Tax=Caballeronia grimmiae TaxID=1071679 RepID=UPI0038BBC32E